MESGGFRVPNEWETVGFISNVKILEQKDKRKRINLPERANTPGTSYISLNTDGSFKQLRIFGKNRVPEIDIDYHIINPKEKRKVFHKHVYEKGIRGKEHIPLTKEEYEKYRRIFEGKRD